MKYFVMATLLIASPALAQEAPVYSGVDSIGGKPNAQAEKPVLFFEAKASWPSLKIAEPRTAWEFTQRGMYNQDDLEDVPAAIADYRRALDLDPHLLIAHARLGTILLLQARTETSSAAAVNLIDESVHEFEEVLLEQPHRAGMHLKIGDAYRLRFQRTNLQANADLAINAYRAELTMAPQSQYAHFALAFLLADLGRAIEARVHVDQYLALAGKYGDPYPYKILAAERLRQSL